MIPASHAPALVSPVPAERRFRRLALLAAVVYCAHFAAAIAGAPKTLVSLAFSLFVLPVPFLGWWAYTRAPPNLRRPFLLLATAATLWLAGTLVWYGYYFAGGRVIPEPPGLWDAFFVPALLLVIAAIVIALRSLISFRLAALHRARGSWGDPPDDRQPDLRLRRRPGRVHAEQVGEPRLGARRRNLHSR